MQNHNIVSTPNITGNIGSCTSQKVEVDTGYNIITKNYQTIVTNSCTGEVRTYDSWELGPIPVIGLILLFLVVFTALIGGVSSGRA